MNEVDRATHVLNNLLQKREVLVARSVDLADERASIALAAHTGDSKASKRLLEITAALAVRASEVESIDAAIKAAGEKCAAAEQAEADKVAAAKAAELRKTKDELAEVFPYLDRHLEEAARAFVAIDRGFAQLRQSGVGPSDAQLRLGLTSVVEAWAMRLPKHVHNQLRDGVRFLPPAERHTASEYWARVRASLDNQISQAAGEAETEKESA
jgi:hypothetical protein